MARTKPTKNDPFHTFKCDGCGVVAGKKLSESAALLEARYTAVKQGWKWHHPGWDLRCPRCQ